MNTLQPKKRRIAIVTPEFKSGGGVRTMSLFLYKTIQASDKYTADIISLATSAKDQASIRLLAPTTWIQAIQCQNCIWKDIPYTHVGAKVTELEFQRYRPRRILTNLLNQYDLIQVVAGGPAIGMVVANTHKPACIFVATTVSQERVSILEQLRGMRGRWAHLMTWVTAKIEMGALNKMTHVFAESLYTQQLLASMVDQSKLSIGVPGIDTEIFYPLSSYCSDSYILSVGRFSDARKNLKLLLTAYHKLIQNYSQCPRLVLAGLDGITDEGQALANALGISPYLDVYQNVTIERLAELYRNASMFVLSSDEEGLGIVILEAMASGLPVVSTKCGGPETAVIDNVTGYLTPIGDADLLAQRIAELLLNPTLRLRMGMAARQVVEAHFSKTVAGNAYLEKYDEILSSTLSNRANETSGVFCDQW